MVKLVAYGLLIPNKESSSCSSYLGIGTSQSNKFRMETRDVSLDNLRRVVSRVNSNHYHLYILSLTEVVVGLNQLREG